MNSEDRNKKIAELEAEISKLKQEFFCSFCGKSSRDLICLIAGPNCFICDECTDICAAMVNERRLRVSANDAGTTAKNAVAAEATKPPSAPK